MRPSQYVERIIDYCAVVDPKKAEEEARRTGGPDIEAFIHNVKAFRATHAASSPFSSQGQSLPPVLYDVHCKRLPVTAKNRMNGQDTTSALYDADTLSKRDAFVSASFADLFALTLTSIPIERQALSCVKTKAQRIELLLVAYSRYQMLRILLVFFDQMRKRVSKIMLEILRKKEFATILADVLVIAKSTKVGLLTASDFVNKEVWVKMETKRIKEIPIFVARQKLLAPQKGAKVDTPRSFWHRKARVARCTERRGSRWIRTEAGRKVVEDFSALLCHMYEEQRRCCKICLVRLTTRQTRAWTNGSIDRIIPGSKGGQYVEDNVQLLCKACNLVKFWYTLPSAKILIGQLGSISLAERASRLEPSKRPVVKSIEDTELNRIVLPWCRRKLENTYYEGATKGKNYAWKEKCSSLELSDLIGMIETNWLGGGFVQDASGLQVPLGLVGLDRVDPNGGYCLENVRLLLIGLNLLKRDDPDDSQVKGYLTHLNGSAFVQSEARKAMRDGHKLPLVK